MPKPRTQEPTKTKPDPLPEAGRVDTRTAAKFLGIAYETLRGWRWQGRCNRGPAFIKVGGKVVYDVADLRAYLDQHRQDPTNAA